MSSALNKTERDLTTCASEGDDFAVRRILLQGYTDPNARDNKGNTPLMMACAKGHHRCVAYLLADTKVDHMLPDSDGFTPLVVAAHLGHVKTIMRFITSHRNLADLDRAIERSKNAGMTDAHALLMKFKKDPNKARQDESLILKYDGDY